MKPATTACTVSTTSLSKSPSTETSLRKIRNAKFYSETQSTALKVGGGGGYETDCLKITRDPLSFYSSAKKRDPLRLPPPIVESE